MSLQNCAVDPTTDRPKPCGRAVEVEGLSSACISATRLRAARSASGGLPLHRWRLSRTAAAGTS